MAFLNLRIMYLFNSPTFLPCACIKRLYIPYHLFLFLKEENDVGEFFLTLEKDPQQEDFLQGRMQGNPYRSVLLSTMRQLLHIGFHCFCIFLILRFKMRM